MSKPKTQEDKKQKEQAAILKKILEDCPAKPAPYTVEEIKEIKRCIHRLYTDIQKELKKDDIALINILIDKIMQDAAIYIKRQELDGLEKNDPLQEVVKQEKALWPKAEKMRYIFKNIQKHVDSLSIQIDHYHNDVATLFRTEKL